MNEKAASAQQKALQERKRGHFDKAVKRLEQAIVQFPDEIDLYLDAVDASLEGGDVMHATNFLKTVQDKFPKEKDRVAQFVRDKLLAVHDPALARYVVENAVKRRDLESALEHLEMIPDHVARDLLARTKTKKQSLKSASHGGYSLRAEMFTNDLLSALLSIRLGNLKEGMAALVEIIDEKPAETKMLLPFLAGLESKQPKVGRIRFAHACALWHNANEVDAIARFVEAAKFDQTAIPVCVARLQTLRDKTKYPAKVERALAEVLLLQGEFDAAATVVRKYFTDHKDSGREVIMLLKPFLDPAHSVNECTWVALDAALSLDQSAAAMEILRPLHQRGNCTPDIYARLQERSKDGSFAIEIMLFHASLALELKDFPRAVEILNAVVSTSPQDVHSVLGLADKHRTSHPGLEELCRKHMQAEATETLSSEEGDFQNFDHNEFSLRRDAAAGSAERSPSAPRAPQAPKPQGEKPASRFAEERPQQRAEKQSFVETRELSFDDEGTPDSGATEEAPLDNPGDEFDADGFETARDLRLSSRDTAPSTPRPAPVPRPLQRELESEFESAPEPATPPVSAPQARPAVKLRPQPDLGATDAHVGNLARRLGEVGAAAFFHIDGSEPEPEQTQEVVAAEVPVAPEPATSRAPIDAMSYASTPAAEAPDNVVAQEPAQEEAMGEPAPEPIEVSAPEPVEAAPPAPAPEPAPVANAPKTYDSELARFRAGELDNAAIVALIERAVEDARVDDLHDLLAFTPANDAERFAQSYYQAEYHALSNRPLPALDLLVKLDEPTLTDEQKERLWVRTAACQRSMNDFAGAKDTLERLVETFPGRSEYERLARRNLEQLLAEQTNAVPVLQKTTSLD